MTELEREATAIETVVVSLIRDAANAARLRLGNKPYDYTGVLPGEEAPRPKIS